MRTRRRVRPPGKRKAATAQDIIHPGSSAGEIPARFKRAYRQLTELRDHLLARQTNLEKDALEEQPSFSQHIADAATDSYDRDLALSMLSSEQDALYEIEQALDRIRHGTYGVCELTGKKIEPERLEAIPWARFSASAERQLEAEGTRKRARLQPRDSVARESAVTREDDYP